jgi:hypothetical protein
MRQKALAPEVERPEFAYGSVWLVGVGDDDPRHFSPLAVHALATADAVVHDAEISQTVLDRVAAPHYREAATPLRAIQRTIKLAEDGWRVVQLVKGDALERAVDSAIRCTERNIPFRVVTTANQPIGGEAPMGLLLVHKALLGGAEAHPALVLLVGSPQSDTAEVAWRRPLDFSMSGLAGQRQLLERCGCSNGGSSPSMSLPVTDNISRTLTAR